jgi:hypothetical protein
MYACSFLGFSVGKNIFYKPEYFDKLEIDDIETLTRVALAGSCSGFKLKLIIHDFLSS